MTRWMAGCLMMVAIMAAGCDTLSFNNPFSKKSPPPATADGSTAAATPAPAPSSEVPELPSSGLQSSASRRFDDVPLPLGVKEDLDRSYVFESSTLKVGRMVYTTKSSINDLAHFYLEECKAGGWTLDSVLQVGGYEMRFKRPGKQLLVTIRNSGGVRPSRTLILNYTPEDGSSSL